MCTAMIASRRLPYIYIQNWKCGCSTVKNTLWTAEHARGTAIPPGYPHQSGDDGPFVDDQTRWEHIEREFVFTIVRNPFTRILSGYLDQIVKRRNDQAWGRLANRYGLSDAVPTFTQFLELLARTPHAEMNPHWRPQYCSVAPKLIPYDFIGSMESFADDLRDALIHIFGNDTQVHTVAGHRTDAGTKLREYYGPAEVALVQQIYEEDFRTLGYSTDPSNELRSAEVARPDPSLLRAWGRASRLIRSRQFDDALDDLRDIRTRMLGPVLDEAILLCARSAAESEVPATSLAAIEVIERDGGIRGPDADLWKRYGQTLRAMGRHEDGLVAEIHATGLRSPGPRRNARLRRAHLRLALVQARKGRADRAVATFKAAKRYADETSGLWARMLDRLAPLSLRVTAAVMWLLGASWWHPDRSVGMPGFASRQHQQIDMADAKA